MEFGDREKILMYRQVLRNTLERLCLRLYRDAYSSKKRLPYNMVAELLHQIHCQYLELLRYSQMVVGDYNLLMEDERCRAEFIQKAIAGSIKAAGVKKALEMSFMMSNIAKISHPEIKLSPIKIGKTEVLL